MTIELDGRQMCDRASLHDQLQARLGFPPWYGRNLDALYDLLTERGEPLTIVLRFQEELKAQLDGYAACFLDTLRQAAENNPALDVRFE